MARKRNAWKLTTDGKEDLISAANVRSLIQQAIKNKAKIVLYADEVPILLQFVGKDDAQT